MNKRNKKKSLIGELKGWVDRAVKQKIGAEHDCCDPPRDEMKFLADRGQEILDRLNRSGDAELKFVIESPGEPGAGLVGFTERVTVTVHEGCADPDSFADHIAESLIDWYDGATVERVKDFR